MVILQKSPEKNFELSDNFESTVFELTGPNLYKSQPLP